MLQSLGIESEMCGKKGKRAAEKKPARAVANPPKRGRLVEFSLWKKASVARPAPARPDAEVVCATCGSGDDEGAP